MDVETLLLVIIMLGIVALLGVSMLIPNTPQSKSCFFRGSEKGSQSFSWGFFIGMLFPIIVFILLGASSFVVCAQGYCDFESLIPILSGLGVLWISVVAIRLITPLFIGRIVSDNGGSYSNLQMTAIRIREKNLTNYIMYILLFAILLFLLFFVDTKKLADVIRSFIMDFGWSRKFLEESSFRTVIAWLFYVLNISALVGMLSTLKMFAGEVERRGNEQLQARKLRDFAERNFKSSF